MATSAGVAATAPVTRTTEVLAAARLDLGDIVRSRWLPVAFGLYGAIALVLVVVAARESGILGFTGMDRVLVSFAHVLLVVLPLLALAATTQVVNRARHDGTIELLFSHPLSRTGYFVAISMTRFLALLAPLVALVSLLALLGRVVWSDAVPLGLAVRALAVLGGLVWAFTAIGLLVSTRTRHEGRAVVLGLVIWGAAVALLDLALVGLLLEWRLPARAVFALAASNPVESARLALLSDLEPELGTLGPVGFYARHALGSGWLFALGAGYPLLVGAAAWALALRSFRRGDLV